MDSQPQPSHSLRLPVDCRIGAIRNVYDAICGALLRNDSVEIDCSGVDKADLTSIQLLLSTTRTAQQQGRQVNLTDISAALELTLQRAGLHNDSLLTHPSAKMDRMK